MGAGKVSNGFCIGSGLPLTRVGLRANSDQEADAGISRRYHEVGARTYLYNAISI